MNKHITRIALAGFAALALTASFFVQGCGNTNGESDTILGPLPNVGQYEPGAGAALSQPLADHNEINGAVQPIAPPPSCEIYRTADVIFVNYSDKGYVVTVNGKDWGLLLPQGNKLVRVPEGDVKWILVEKGSGKPSFSGYLFAKRCDSYKIKVNFDPRRIQNPEYVD
jgi:hypothetical protein